MPGYLEKLKKMPAIVREGSSPTETPLRGNAVYAVSPPWDQPRADAALAACERVLDEAIGREADPARKRVAEVYRGVVRRYHAQRDPYLFDAARDIGSGLLARWRASRS